MLVAEVDTDEIGTAFVIAIRPLGVEPQRLPAAEAVERNRLVARRCQIHLGRGF